MVFGVRAPGRAGIVDQDVDLAVTRHHRRDNRRRGFRFAQIGCDGQHLDALAGQMRACFFELGGLARGDRHRGTHFTERFGDLQAQPARTAGDDRHPAAQIHQFLETHFRLSVVQNQWSCMSSVLLSRRSSNSHH